MNLEPPSQEKEDIILEARHLSRQVKGDKLVVNDVSLAVRRGETLAITGPSGSGKSSLLRLLNRLDEPSGGTVFLDGKDYKTLPPRDLRRRVGMVMQSASLFPGTVADNIAFGPQSRGEKVDPQHIAELLEKVQLPGYEQRDISTLSGGEAQRVSLARTLMNEPEILLLDEPTSALDETTRKEIENLLKSVMDARQLTNIIVTHDMEQAARLANRVAVIEAGKLVRLGPVNEVLHHEAAS